jgi:hypothetical protein
VMFGRSVGVLRAVPPAWFKPHRFPRRWSGAGRAWPASGPAIRVGRKIASAAVYKGLAPNRFEDFWRD